MTFTETEFDGHLHLGAMDIAGLRNLCQESQSEEFVPGSSFPSSDDNTHVDK